VRPQRGVWSDLMVGSYLKDANGKTWKVIAERELHLQIQDRDGNKAHLQPRPPSTPVTILVATEGEAVAALQDRLGAAAIARREAGETGWLVPDFPTQGAPNALADARSHMIMMHGVWGGDIKTMVALTEAHIASHHEPGKGYQEHTHPGGNPKPTVDNDADSA
jgi:hypothetical protein